MPTVIRKGSTALIEQPGSPRWTFGESITCTRQFTASDHAVALAAAPMRGAIGTGIVSGYRVRETVVNRVRGGLGELIINYENFPGLVPGQGAQLPNDEAEITGDDVERALQRHPRYAGLSQDTLDAINTMLHSAKDGATWTEIKPEVVANALALELYLKLRRDFTHYVTPAPVYRLVIYSWTPPTNLSQGTFRQAPPTSPIVAPAGLDWLRKPDRLTWNGSHWVLEKKWIGYVDLDDDIYP